MSRRPEKTWIKATFPATADRLPQTLDEQDESFETFRRLALDIVTEDVRPKNKMQRFLKRLRPDCREFKGANK